MGGKVGRVEVKKVEARCKSELGVRVEKGATSSTCTILWDVPE